MVDDGSGLLPSLVILTTTCSHSDMSTMSASRSERTDQESVVRQLLEGMKKMDELDEGDSDGDESGKSDKDYEKEEYLKAKRKRRKKALEDIAVQFLEENKRRKPTVAVEKQVTRVEDLLEVNTLALDK